MIAAIPSCACETPKPVDESDAQDGITPHQQCRPNEVVLRFSRISLQVFLLFTACNLWLPGALSAEVQQSVPGRISSYDVHFEGVEDEGLLKSLRERSRTELRKDESTPSVGLLRSRALRDREEFIDVLRSLAYYGATVEFEIREAQEPVQVVFRVTPGDIYPIRSVDVEVQPPAPELERSMPSPVQMGLTPGTPAKARGILDAGSAIVRRARERGYPFASVGEPRVIVDHLTQDVVVKFTLETGPFARFGDTAVVGLESVERSYVFGKLPWKRGDPYNEALLDQLRKRLGATRLFSVIRVDRSSKMDTDGTLPVTVDVKERKRRSVRGGASYRTDEGFGGSASWEHRNLLGKGERLMAGVVASQISFAAEGAFEKMDFLRSRQTLNARVRLADDDTEAYQSRNVESNVVVHRELGQGLKVSAGPGFRFSEVDDVGLGWEEFATLSFPAQLELDMSDDLLDPTRGFRLKLFLGPYWDLLDTDMTFVKALMTCSHYLPLFPKPSLVLATRGAVGGLWGAERDSVAPDLRFYAGGGGSVRGFPYQSVSPLGRRDKPIGGRSLVEVSAELRWKITDSLGLVTFIDGGGAFEPSFPDFSSTFRWGAGAGVRYYTPIGPLRLDMGVPINRREGIDDWVQIYVSIGQAF